MGESQFGGKNKSGGVKVIGRKGIRQAFQVSMNITGQITVIMAIIASGTVIPPRLFFSNNSIPYGEMGVPGTWSFTSSKSGIIDTNRLLSWFKDAFIPFLNVKRPVLLLLDNHASHVSTQFIDLAIKENMRLLFLPAKTSLKLQPLDIGILPSLKALCEECGEYSCICWCKTTAQHIFCKGFV